MNFEDYMGWKLSAKRSRGDWRFGDHEFTSRKERNIKRAKALYHEGVDRSGDIGGLNTAYRTARDDKLRATPSDAPRRRRTIKKADAPLFARRDAIPSARLIRKRMEDEGLLPNIGGNSSEFGDMHEFISRSLKRRLSPKQLGQYHKGIGDYEGGEVPLNSGRWLSKTRRQAGTHVGQEDQKRMGAIKRIYTQAGDTLPFRRPPSRVEDKLRANKAIATSVGLLLGRGPKAAKVDESAGLASGQAGTQPVYRGRGMRNKNTFGDFYEFARKDSPKKPDSRGPHDVKHSRGPHDVKHGTLSAEQRKAIAEAGRLNRANIEYRKKRGTYHSEFGEPMRNFGDDQFLLFFANQNPDAFQEVASEFHEFGARRSAERIEGRHTESVKASSGKAGLRGTAGYTPNPWTDTDYLGRPQKKGKFYLDPDRRAGHQQRRGAIQAKPSLLHRATRGLIGKSFDPEGEGKPLAGGKTKGLMSSVPKHSEFSHLHEFAQKDGSRDRRDPNDRSRGRRARAQNNRQMRKRGVSPRDRLLEGGFPESRIRSLNSEFGDYKVSNLNEFSKKRKVAMGKKMLRFMEEFQLGILNGGEKELMQRVPKKDIPPAILEKFSN